MRRRFAVPNQCWFVSRADEVRISVAEYEEHSNTNYLLESPDRIFGSTMGLTVPGIEAVESNETFRFVPVLVVVGRARIKVVESSVEPVGVTE